MILGITLGDITGIGPEVALRAVARLTAEDTDVHYVLIGDTGVVRRLCGLMGVEAEHHTSIADEDIMHIGVLGSEPGDGP